MGLIEFIKKLWSGKIQINITIINDSAPGVEHTTDSRSLDSVNIVRHNRSNYRFVHKECDDSNGHYWYTQEYTGIGWKLVSDSWFADKKKAIEAHLKLIEFGTLKKPDVETVMWEGLSLDEAKVMGVLNV